MPFLALHVVFSFLLDLALSWLVSSSAASFWHP